jgi:hypothetical protein
MLRGHESGQLRSCQSGLLRSQQRGDSLRGGYPHAHGLGAGHLVRGQRGDGPSLTDLVAV